MRVLRRTSLIGLLAAAAAPAVASPGSAVATRTLTWSAEPAVLVPIVVTTLWYLAGYAKLQRVGSFVRLFGPRRLAMFLAGQLTLVLALLSPLDGMAGQLFSAHMLQHMLLLMVAAPLLVWGRPAIVGLWAFGPVGRRRLGSLWSTLGLGAGIDGLMQPVVVWLLFCGVFVVWHFPGPYQWALHDETVHTFEHLSFLVTALMFWTVVIEPSGHRRLTYGATLLFILTSAIVSSLPGAIITLASVPLYSDHAAGAAAWGLTSLQDQQLAGLLMWIPGGVIYLAAAAGAFLKWLEMDDERRTGHKARARQRAVVVPEPPEAPGGAPEEAPAAPRPAALGRHALLGLCVGLALSTLLLAGCGRGANAMATSIGDPQRGVGLIRAAGCGSCHLIPGVNDAAGLVGPPLSRMGRRIYIAGLLRNTPANMVTWLRSPQGVVPGNAMPDMGLTERDARDITAYLYTLQ